MIYTTYAPDTDTTFIMEDTERPDGTTETRVMGFYYGNPNGQLPRPSANTLEVGACNCLVV